jgi:hypothetical protein
MNRRWFLRGLAAGVIVTPEIVEALSPRRTIFLPPWSRRRTTEELARYVASFTVTRQEATDNLYSPRASPYLIDSQVWFMPPQPFMAYYDRHRRPIELRALPVVYGTSGR